MSFRRKGNIMAQVKYYMFVFLACISHFKADPAEVNYNELHGTLPNNYVQHTDNIHNQVYRQDATSGLGDNEDWASYRDRMFREALIRLSNATSVEDILGLGFVGANGHPLSAHDLSASYDSSQGKLLINGKGELAVPDQCSPREVSVPVNVSVMPADTVLHPKCIKVHRCGGCCIMPNVACEPVATEKVVYNLMKLTVSKDDMINSIHVTGVYPLEVIQHTRCGCRCTLSDSLCGPLKAFDDRLCSCRCNEATTRRRCGPPHFFNPETCRCECAQRLPCCSAGDYCELTFNERTCACDVGKMLISASANITNNKPDVNIPKPHATVQENKHHEGILPERIVSPHVKDTAKEKNDPCQSTACPLRFDKKVTKEGFCVCTPRMRGRHGDINPDGN